MRKQDKLKNISEETIKRYSERYKKLGNNIKTLGWGTQEQQLYRFEQVLLSVDIDKKSILDIGCGFGDLYFYIKYKKLNISRYIGWDINKNLITEAKNRICDNKSEFKVENMFDVENIFPVADIGIMLGLLNFNLKSTMDNYEYTEIALNNAFKCINDVLIVDFLSTNLDKNYPKEDFVFYHDPAKVLNIALKITNNIVLKHNYMPIPQKEFMLFLYK